MLALLAPPLQQSFPPCCSTYVLILQTVIASPQSRHKTIKFRFICLRFRSEILITKVLSQHITEAKTFVQEMLKTQLHITVLLLDTYVFEMECCLGVTDGWNVSGYLFFKFWAVSMHSKQKLTKSFSIKKSSSKTKRKPKIKKEVQTFGFSENRTQDSLLSASKPGVLTAKLWNRLKELSIPRWAQTAKCAKQLRHRDCISLLSH